MDWKMFVLYNEVHYKKAIAKAIVNSKYMTMLRILLYGSRLLL